MIRPSLDKYLVIVAVFFQNVHRKNIKGVRFTLKEHLELFIIIYGKIPSFYLEFQASHFTG